MATAGIVVSVSMGVMKPLLSKLTTLMGDKYKKLRGVRKQVSFLKDELTAMDAFLESLELMGDNLDPSAKHWRSNVREMAYDIEDCIDDFFHNLESASGAHESEGFVKRTARRLRTLRVHHRIANQMDELKARVLEAGERRKRYNLDEHLRTSGPSSSMVVDPRVKAMYTEAANLVGIDGPREELVKMLTDQAEQRLKVVSIVGFGGLGKTTLAKEAYHNILSNDKFGCNAFVSVSQTPDISSVLTSIQSKLGVCNSSPVHDMQDIIDNIKDHLKHKRYLIVVDDLWDVQSWEIIKCVFPENRKHSRVIVTTRHQDVAMSCSSGKGDIHCMKPLSDQDSRKLFNNRIFNSEDGCPPQFIDVSREILKKCGGLPLAIITVAGILACRPTGLKEEWEHIQDCLLASEAPPTNSTLADMMHILDLSYKFLPRHLKACFLYLGTYPEDHEIDKNELVRKWVAEGFVSGPTRRGAWDVAERYLNELVNRSMIQPVYNKLFGIIVETQYKVHDMMIDLILKRCMEDNFIRLEHDPQAMVELQVKVRRLIVHTSADVTIGRQLSQVRSLSLFRANFVPSSLSELRFLRVLFLLEFPGHPERIDLTCVSHLSQLRYLKVARKARSTDGPCHVVLPNHVRSMHCLETLEIQHHLDVSSIPPDIVDLPCLCHLIVSEMKMLPDGIGKVKTLRTLRTFRLQADSSGVVIESLSELTNLAELFLDCRHVKGSTRGCIPMTTAWMAAWSFSLLKLGNLRELYVQSYPYSCRADALMSTWVSPPFPFLEKLDVAGWTFSRVPRWIGALHNLRILTFGVEEVSNLTWDDVATIGMLPNLIILGLRVEGGVPDEGILIGGSTGFKLLAVFYLQIKNTSHLAFDAGAMPNLRVLELTVDPNECDKATAPVGLEHLASLLRIYVYGAKGYTQTLSQDVEASFDAFCAMFQEAISGLPTPPALVTGYAARVYRPWDEEGNN